MKLKVPNARLFPIVCLLLIFVAACNSDDTLNSNAPVISVPPKTSLPMPPLSGNSLTNMGWRLSNGGRTSISQQQGKILILDFYATWCFPCRESIPHLIELQSRYKNDLSVVGLNVGGPEDLAEVPAFAREFNIPYPLGIPDDELVSVLLADSDAIPQTFVFDRKGKLIRRFVGFDQRTGKEMNEIVDQAVQTTSDR